MNKLSASEQANALWTLIRTRPIQVGVLLFIVLIFSIGAEKYDPLIIKYNGDLGEKGGQVETFILVNPNVDRQEVTANFSIPGDRSDLGLDEAYAVDAVGKTIHPVKFNLLKKSVSVLSIIRDKLDKNSAKFPEIGEIERPSSAMRVVAFAYVVSLIFSVKDYLAIVASIFSAFFLFDMTKAVRRIFR